MATKTKKTTTTKKTKTTKPAAKAKATRPAKAASAATATEPAKKLSQIDAAMAVLANAGEPMNCKAMVEAMATQGLWSSPGGKTPDATLYASILRDLKNGADARFKKVARGQFALAGK
ncbi:MAG: winged helix-turn-helix domain-containing protein [Planctomycetaceae bacterium]